MFRTFEARLSAVAVACLASALLLVALVSYGFFRSSVRSYSEAGYASYTETMRERMDTLFETTLATNAYLLLDQDMRALYGEIRSLQTLAEYRSVTDRIDRLVGQRLLLHPADLLDISILAPGFVYNRTTDVMNRLFVPQQQSVYDLARVSPGAFIEVPTEGYREGRQPPVGVTFAGLVPETDADSDVIAVMTVKPATVLSDDEALDMAIVNDDGDLIWRLRNLLDVETAAQASQDAARTGPGWMTQSAVPDGRLVFYARSRSRDWTYVFLFEAGGWQEDARAYAGFLATTGTVVLVAFGLLAALASRGILRPLTQLKDAAGEVSENPRSRHPAGLVKVLNRLPIRVSLRTTLVLLLGGITIAACGVTILFAQLSARERLTARIEASALATLEQRKQSIRLVMSQVERQSAYLAVTSSLQDLDQWRESEGVLRREIDEMMLSQRVFADGIASIELYSRDGDLLYSNRAGASRGTSPFESLAEIPEIPQGNAWLPARLSRSERDVITFVRHIRSRNNLAEFGFLFVGVDERRLTDRIATPALRPGSLSFVIDGESTILAHENQTLLGQPLSALFTSSDATGDVEIDNRSYRRITIDLDRAGWTLVDLVPGHYISSDLGAFTLTVLLSMLPVIMVTLSAVRLLSGRLSRPLERMTQHIEQVSFAVLGHETYSHSGDEVHQLASAFDTMLVRLNTLIEEGFVHEIRERELEARRRAAELKALQFQINPHFLYNTFASVSFLIRLGESASAVEMVTALTTLLRKAASSSQVIAVAEEVAYVEAYLTIIRMRHHGQIQCSVSVAPDIGDASILKFTLQPLIENAVMHGILEGSGVGTIELSGRAVGETIVFTVRDDGIGLEPSRLEEIRRGLDEHEHGHARAVGLTNVLERLRLYYGADATLTIDNGIDRGCVTSVIVPRRAVPEEATRAR